MVEEERSDTEEPWLATDSDSDQSGQKGEPNGGFKRYPPEELQSDGWKHRKLERESNPDKSSELLAPLVTTPVFCDAGRVGDQFSASRIGCADGSGAKSDLH